MPDVAYLSDRRYWSSFQAAWQAGLPSRAPAGVDIVEWRESARRLARHLDCRIRTGLQEKDGVATDAVAVANEGYPLGLVDPYDRDAWERHQANVGD